ncbi:hypothetical protein VCRA2114O370_10148 [Vibrio crassostreae]|nr:hypothetical protein VCRA2114O367_10148 [Vibrio crassostreae]CAK2638797.1 hypothetical protein VCRA2114O370_10148 [Vibrio crassostreae]CAK3806387.1 hypothetical protein VCRA2123O394_10149 [Vibrio crassostreae]
MTLVCAELENENKLIISKAKVIAILLNKNGLLNDSSPFDSCNGFENKRREMFSIFNFP